MITFAEIEVQMDDLRIGNSPADAVAAADALLQIGEVVLEQWVLSRDLEPTSDTHEDFRLLALQRQGSRGEPSFNACRETCRELAYYYNLISLDPGHAETPKRFEMMKLVARHVLYFVSGKLEQAGLGDFCCSSRPLRSTMDETSAHLTKG